MIKYAYVSLKGDKGRAFFYWLTFLITSIFIFLFFNLSFTKGLGFTLGKDDNSLVTLIAVIISCVCMAVVFFANDFFVKRKSLEIAVDMMCGSTYLQLVEFLLIQTGIIFILAVPVGVLIGYALLPVLNIILHSFLGYKNATISMNLNSITITFSILLFEMVWCTILNLGYAFRNTIANMLLGEEKIKAEDNMVFHVNFHVHKYFFLALFIIPLPCCFLIENSMDIMVYAALGIIGIYGTIKKIIIVKLKENVATKYMNDSNKMIYMGLLKEDLILSDKIIILLIFSAIIFIAILTATIDSPIQSLISLVSFVVSVLLLSLAVMFKFASETDRRNKIFSTLNKVGYLDKDIKLIKRREIMLLYGIILFFGLSYISVTAFTMYIKGFMQLNLAFLLIILFIVPIVIAALLNIVQYNKQKTSEIL